MKVAPLPDGGSRPDAASRRKDLTASLLLAKTLGFDIIADPMKFADGTEIRRATKFEDGDRR